MVFPGKSYDQLTIDDTFADSLTVTETYLVLAAGIFGDFNPLPVDEWRSAANPMATFAERQCVGLKLS